MKMRSVLAALSLLGFSGAALAASDTIAASDQKIANKSVTATSVEASKPGYLVVHEADATGAKAGKIIGTVAVKAGETKSVVVPLTEDVKPGSKLILMLHEESNADAKFDDKDKPVMASGKVVMQTIAIQ